jgi:hypothetical protein
VKRQKGSVESNKVAKYLFCIWNCVKKEKGKEAFRRQINKSKNAKTLRNGRELSSLTLLLLSLVVVYFPMPFKRL